MTPNPMLADGLFFGINVFSKSPRQNQEPLRTIVNALLPAKIYELQKRKAISIFRTTKGFQLTLGLGVVAVFRVTSARICC